MAGKVRESLIGRRFGRLLVVDRAGSSRRGISCWKCVCDCGATPIVRRDHLLTANTQSCGCLTTEVAGKPSLWTRSWPKQARPPCYRVWQGMWSRCTNPRTPDYADYGGRGVKVCARWAVFAHFVADMGARPSPRHSIDRIDVNGNYEPANCRWATPTEQTRNRRSPSQMARDRARRPSPPAWTRRNALAAYEHARLTVPFRELQCVQQTIEAQL